ncbi:MAG: isochorismatase family cysteine hydrolase [Patescibacteria group bacterium]
MNQSNTGLLLIDIVNGCAHQECEDPEINVTFSKIREMIPNLINFVKEYKEKVNNNVIYINITPWDKKHLPKNIQELYTDPGVEYYSDDNSGFPEEFYQIKPDNKDIIVTKNTYDAFADTELEKILKDKNIQYLVTTGIFTDGCVLSTIVNGFSKGFNFIVLKDLIETVDNEERQEISKLLKKCVFPSLYGKTITSKEFLTDRKNENN